MKIRSIIIIGLLIHGFSGVFGQYSDFKYKRKNHSTDQGYFNTTKEARYISGGIGINLCNYIGDMTPAEKMIINTLKVTRLGASLFGTYHFSNLFGVEAELQYARITGDDFNTDPYHPNSSIRKYTRNLSFRNDLIGLSLRGHFNILNDPFEYYKRRDYNIYLLGGITMYYSNPKAKLHDNSDTGATNRWTALRPLGTEGQNHPDIGNKYSSIQLGIPFGIGVRIRLSYRLDLNLEGSLTYILSDYIDDVGSSYVDLGAIEGDLGKALSDRSKEAVAVMKDEQRDKDVINATYNIIEYTSEYDGNTYQVYEGFGQQGATRGGDRHDLIGISSIKISYIFTK